MVDFEKPEAKQNGQTGTLIHARVRLLPLGPAGPFELHGFLMEHHAEGPEPVGHMEFRADSLVLLENGLIQFRESYRGAMKALMEEFQKAKLTGQIDPRTVEMIRRSKGS